MKQKIKVICIPYAGGNSYAYKNFKTHFTENFEYILVELPGRGTRVDEALLYDAQSLVNDVHEQVKEHLNGPYVIFGHSMGGLLGYLLAKKIVARGIEKPLYMFFTGCEGPMSQEDEEAIFELPKDEFISKIKELGGSPIEILNNDELMAFYEPILRADFTVTDTYKYEKTEPFDIPLMVIIGINEKITFRQANTWRKETTGPIEIRQLPGNHFFLFDYEADIVKLMMRKISTVAPEYKGLSLKAR